MNSRDFDACDRERAENLQRITDRRERADLSLALVLLVLFAIVWWTL